MGYLVYCTTCNGTMSNNASTCPHCGESGFKRYEEEVYYTQCGYCNGTGKRTSSNMATYSCSECDNGKVRNVRRTKTIDSRRKV